MLSEHKDLIVAGINFGTAVIPAVLDYLKTNKDVEIEDLRNYITSQIKVDDANIYSDKIISLLADEALITISGTKIHSMDTISYKTENEGILKLKNHLSTTPNTEFRLGTNGFADLNGNTEIVQDESGFRIVARKCGSTRFGFKK